MRVTPALDGTGILCGHPNVVWRSIQARDKRVNDAASVSSARAATLPPADVCRAACIAMVA